MRATSTSDTATEHVVPRDHLGALRRRAWIIIVCAMLVPAASFAVSATATKKWTATAKLLFRDPGFDQKLFGSSFLAPSTDPAREAATNVKLVSLEAVSERAARRLGDGITALDIERRVKVTTQGQSDLVAIDATDRDPRSAARLANAVAVEYIEFRRAADRAKIQQALQLGSEQLRSLARDERNGPEGRALRDRAGQLQTLSSLQTGNAELVQPAPVPLEPSFPRTARNVVLGGVLGILLGLLLAALAERVDRRLRDHDEIEALIDRPILAEIPESNDLGLAPVGAARFGGRELESFRTLRTSLRYLNVGRQIDSVIIASAAPGEGKSTIAMNLAVAYAASGARVALVEADLRRPRLGELLSLPGQTGLSGLLVGDGRVEDAIQPYVIEQAIPAGELAVLPAGGIPPNPSDLLASARMVEVLEELERRYDHVVIDTPPLTVVSDAVPLIQHAHGVIVVVRSGQSTRPAVRELRRRLDNLEVRPLGVVLNSADLRAGFNYSDYSYYQAAPTGSIDSQSNGRHVPDAEHTS